MKPIRLSRHAQEHAARRGATEAEIHDAIRSAAWVHADHSRLECRKDFPYGREWNGSEYETKQVRPIFVDEPMEIDVVTVYVYFF